MLAPPRSGTCLSSTLCQHRFFKTSYWCTKRVATTKKMVRELDYLSSNSNIDVYVTSCQNPEYWYCLQRFSEKSIASPEVLWTPKQLGRGARLWIPT